MLIDELIDSSFIQYNYITDMISLHPLIVNTIQKNDPDFVDDCQIYIRNLTRQLSSFTHLKSTEKRTLLSLAEVYYLKWRSPSRSFDIPFMEYLAEAYAEYFIRDKSIAIMKRLLTLNPRLFPQHFCFFSSDLLQWPYSESRSVCHHPRK